MRLKTTLNRVMPAIVLFGSLLAGLSSCKKDNNENTPPPVSVTTKIKEYKNGEDFIKFEYNGDGTIKTATVSNDVVTDGNTITYQVSYNAQKKITQLQSSAGEKIVPVYENGVMTRADIFEGAEKTGFTNYHYEDQQLTKATLYWGADNDFIPFFEFNFEYNNGNPVKTVVMMATAVPGQLVRAGHVELSYDNKTNPLYAYNDLLALFWQTTGKNNIKQEDHFDANLIAEDRYVYTYTYSANGLPQHADVKIGLPGQPETNSQVEYIY